MTTDVFDRIRLAASEVTRRATFVAIDEARLEAMAADLARRPWPTDDLDPARHFEGDATTKLAFTLLLDAINFGSGWFPLLDKPQGLSGYRTVATACLRRFEEQGSPSPAALRATTPESMAEMLGQDLAHRELRELMVLFAQAWRDFGQWLSTSHADRFESVVESAGACAARLVASLAEMPLYRDVARYDELEVPFYKRAQITVADLDRAFGGESWGHFDDLDRLTLFADNLVPHVLRCHGVLVYEEELARRIERGALLEVGSRQEVEIRAVALEAVERLVVALEARARPISAHALDGLLWNAGQAPEIKARPRHRARCPYY